MFTLTTMLALHTGVVPHLHAEELSLVIAIVLSAAGILGLTLRGRSDERD